MFFKLFFKIVQAVSEAIAVTFIYLGRHKSEPKVIAKIALIIRKTVFILLMLKIPISLIFGKKDDEEKAIKIAFVNLSLLESLSYYEWKDFEQIWDKIKDDERLHACFKNKEGEEISIEEIKKAIFALTLIFAQLGLFEIRTENKEEYVKEKTRLKVVHGDKNKELDPKNIPEAYKEKLEGDYSELENLPGYERFANGIRIVFLRKPLGKKKDTQEQEKIFSLIPRFN